MVNNERLKDEYFRRAMIYWEFYQFNKAQKYLDNYYFWYVAYTDGKQYAIRNMLP